jgi:hypothetical protein
MRTLTERTFTDEFFGRLSMDERLLWLGLILACADDQGRLIDNAILIRNAIFAFDDMAPAHVDEMLDKFSHASKILRYVAGTNGTGKKLIQIVNWWRYQKSASWMMPSIYPAPELWIDRCRYHGQGRKIIEVNWYMEGGFSTDKRIGYLETNQPLASGQASLERRGEEIRGEEEEITTTVPPQPAVVAVEAKTDHENHQEKTSTIQREGDGVKPSVNNDYTHGDTGKAISTFMDVSCNARDCEQLYRQITDQITLPPDQREKALQILMIILSHFQGNIQEAAKSGGTVFDRWCATKSKANNKPYSRTNTNWLNWWLEEISPANETVKAVSNINIPKPSVLCTPGAQLWAKANEAKNTGFFQQALLTYQTHISTCNLCSGASNAKQVIGQISALAGRMSA